MSRRMPLSSTARKALLVVAFVAVFLTVGVPRFLAGDDAPVSSNGDANFAKLCREHGGTPAPASNGEDQRCTVRYGRNVYLMDAITPQGFDADTARFQRQGCEEAQREQKSASGKPQRTFVYHPTTGVCEHRP